MTKFKNLKVGEKLSETQYYSVEKISGNRVQLINQNEQRVVVDNGYVEQCLTSANQHDGVKKITRTEMAKLFIENPNIVFTVSFNKQVKEADVVKEVMETYEASTIKSMATAVKKAIKKALNGEERVLVGYHTGVQDDFGRISAVDMNIAKDPSKDYNTALRLVDPRQLNYLIIKGVRYETK